MSLSPEVVNLYANKISKGLRLLGVFYFVFSFLQYLLRNPELSLAAIFIPLVIFVVYLFYCRKILVGKVSILPTVLILLAVTSPLVFILPSYMESSIITDNEKIRITGVYGEEIALDQIKQFFLADTLPNITMRTNGISTGTINKGYFRSSSLQKNVKLLLCSGSKPYLYIIYEDNKYVILNFRNSEKTLKMFEQLKELIRNE